MSEAAGRSPWADVTLTADARNVLDRAGTIASARGVPPYMGDAMDVLTALLQVRGTLAQQAIRDLGIDPGAVAKSLPADNGVPGLPLRQVVLNSSREATVLGHYQVDSIHLLLTMLYSDTPATSAVLQAAGVTLYDLRRHLQTAVPPTETPARTPARGPAAPPQRATRPDAGLRRKPLLSLRGVLGVSPVFLGLIALTAVGGGALWFDFLPQASVVVFVVGGWVVSLCVHEFAHALVAYVGGDRSVAGRGYLSLNPLLYANAFMSILLPIAFLLLGGIGLPGGAVYIDHAAIRSRAWDSAVSVAGPVGTLVCGLLIAAVLSLPGHGSWVIAHPGFFFALAFLGFIEVSAVVLNLIPIPGLDGFGILAPWLPISARLLVYRYATFAMIGLFLALFYLPPVRDAYFQTIFNLSAMVNIDPGLALGGYAEMPHL